MVLMLSIAATVQAVTVDNIMTELQMQHAVQMASVPSGSDDIGVGSNVMALHPNGQIRPGSVSRLEEFTDGTVIYTVTFLDRTASRVGLQNIHHRDNTVSYDNFGSTALCNVNVNSTNMPGGMGSGNGGSAAAGGSGAGPFRVTRSRSGGSAAAGGSAPPGPFRGAGSSSPASLHAGPFLATRSRNGGSSAAGGTMAALFGGGGPATVAAVAPTGVLQLPNELLVRIIRMMRVSLALPHVLTRVKMTCWQLCKLIRSEMQSDLIFQTEIKNVLRIPGSNVPCGADTVPIMFFLSIS